MESGVQEIYAKDFYVKEQQVQAENTIKVYTWIVATENQDLCIELVHNETMSKFSVYLN